MSLIKIEYALVKQLHMQPSEIWAKPFYEIEYLLDLLQEDNEEQRRQQEKESEGSGKTPGMGDMKSMMRDSTNSMKNIASGFKMPSMPKLH